MTSCNCHNNTYLYPSQGVTLDIIPYEQARENLGISVGGCNGAIEKTIRDVFTKYPDLQNVQFYVGADEQKWNFPKSVFNNTRQDVVRDLCRFRGRKFFLHTPVNMNLSRHDRKGKVMFNNVQLHCKYLENMPGSCVLHVGNGKYGGTIEDVAQNINRLEIPYNDSHQPTLLLENSSGSGHHLGWSLEEFRHLYEGMDRSKIGICIDTQHTFSSGWSQFENGYAVEKLWEDFDSVFGKPALIHLNDSKVPSGDRADKHENLRQGYIWHNDFESLLRLRELAQDDEVHLTLETPHSRLHDDFIVLSYPLSN